MGAFVPPSRPFVPRVLASAAMGILSRVESFLERFLEAPAGRLGASIQPVSLAKRIERAMDTNKTYRDVGVIVPNHYALHLHPNDFAAFASYRSSLEDDLAHGVLARARHERYTLVARPRVEILADDGTRRGEIRVAANVVDERGERLREATPMPASPDTMVFDRVRPSDAPDSARRAYLLVSTRGSRPVQFDLGGPLIGIGRASDNDVIVDDPMVSRHHCQLRLQHGAYGFADLGSRNGSTVNGQPVTQIALGPGDLIRVGDTEIEFQVRG
jgi:Protein of unknown function (DUF3662)/FHA domain